MNPYAKLYIVYLDHMGLGYTDRAHNHQICFDSRPRAFLDNCPLRSENTTTRFHLSSWRGELKVRFLWRAFI